MVTFVLPCGLEMEKIKVVEYFKDGVSSFGEWFNRLDPHAAAKAATALYRLEQGNFSNVKSVGKGVSEYKILGRAIGFILVKRVIILSYCLAGVQRKRKMQT